jgi:hypothetical protein
MRRGAGRESSENDQPALILFHLEIGEHGDISNDEGMGQLCEKSSVLLLSRSTLVGAISL